jgi:hypothetical protein
MVKLERSGSLALFTPPSIPLGLGHGYGELAPPPTLGEAFLLCWGEALLPQEQFCAQMGLEMDKL